MAVLILNDAALMDIGACCGILINLRYAKFCAILANAVFRIMWHLSYRSCVVAESLIGSNGDSYGPQMLLERLQSVRPLGM